MILPLYPLKVVLLPQIYRQISGIITTLVSGFIGLAYEGISSFPPMKM